MTVDSRDEDGHFCGQSAETGAFVSLGPGKVGYCGPSCLHCLSRPTYAVQDDVWTCGGCWDPRDREAPR